MRPQDREAGYDWDLSIWQMKVSLTQIIVSGQSGGHLAVQVKATNGLTWQFDIRKFMDVQLSDDGKQQVAGRHPEPFPDLMCVLVVLKEAGRDRFFVLEWKELQDVLSPNGDAVKSAAYRML
jgi:hypothetical protein